MGDKRVPDWHVTVGRGIRPEEVYGVFCALLDDLPMSRTELARRLGITQPAVSRWATGDARPGLAQMRAAVDVIAARTIAIQNTLWRADRVVSLVEEAVETYTPSSAKEDPASQEARRSITGRLAELLEEA